MRTFLSILALFSLGGCAATSSPVEPSVGLLVRLQAAPGREAEVEELLEAGLGIVEDEPGTPYWFAVRMGDGAYGIFDAFPAEPEREAHLAGALAAALMERAPELLAGAPAIETVDVLAAKLP